MLIQYSDVIRGMNGTIQENQKLCCIEQYPAPGDREHEEQHGRFNEMSAKRHQELSMLGVCNRMGSEQQKPKLTGFLKSNDILEQWSILNPKTYNLAITTLNGHHITTHTLHDAHRKIPRDLIHQTLFRNCRKPQHKNLITHKFELPNPPKPHLQPPNSTRVAAPPRRRASLVGATARGGGGGRARAYQRLEEKESGDRAPPIAAAASIAGEGDAAEATAAAAAAAAMAAALSVTE
uniref:Uncharacterized protein n=1 Tax=Oryza nivara TaxID=4536 RepID=A0A0E0I826_ORYNI